MVRFERMTRKFVTGLVLASVAAAALIFLWPSDEKRIKKLLKEGASAVEFRDIAGVMSRISYNYRDDYGMTYFYLKETLKKEFEKLSDVKVEYGDPQVKIFRQGKMTESAGELSFDRAIVEIDVRVLATIGTETGYIVGDPKSPLNLRFTLDKEQMGWRIVKTEGLNL